MEKLGQRIKELWVSNGLKSTVIAVNKKENGKFSSNRRTPQCGKVYTF